MFIAIYKPYELADGRTMWERVQTDNARIVTTSTGVSNFISYWNAGARTPLGKADHGGLWIRILVASPKPARFMFREELSIWKNEVLPHWEQRL